jgi:hypothetical protein
MDPFLERHWQPVHKRLAVVAADLLNEVLPGDLIADIEERTEIVPAGDAGGGWRQPDAYVAEPAGGADSSGAVATVDAPVVADIVHEPATQRFVQVFQPGDARLVTVIEFVSPANKREPGLSDFRQKRADLLNAGVHVVEIDLTRAGNWQRLLGEVRVHDPLALQTTYRACCRVAGNVDQVFITPIPLRQSLPTLQVPLRPDDVAVRLDLQAAVTRVFGDGQYARRGIYVQTLEPPLAAGDAAWAARLVEQWQQEHAAAS